jgi:hypothetical protein
VKSLDSKERADFDSLRARISKGEQVPPAELSHLIYTWR